VLAFKIHRPSSVSDVMMSHRAGALEMCALREKVAAGHARVYGAILVPGRVSGRHPIDGIGCPRAASHQLSGTRLANDVELEPISALLRPIGPLAVPGVKAVVARNLGTLKELLESNCPAAQVSP
jgi:hypothetical protein